MHIDLKVKNVFDEISSDTIFSLKIPVFNCYDTIYSMKMSAFNCSDTIYFSEVDYRPIDVLNCSNEKVIRVRVVIMVFFDMELSGII